MKTNLLWTFHREQQSASGGEASRCRHADDHSRPAAALCPCKPHTPEVGIHLERVTALEDLKKEVAAHEAQKS
jgi:hypothetical protein